MGSVGQGVPTFSYKMIKFWRSKLIYSIVTVVNNVYLKFAKIVDLKCFYHTHKNEAFIEKIV